MVEKLKEQKDLLLERLERLLEEKGPEGANLQEVGMLTDQIKDLAEAEKACWEAEYYMTVTEAMEDGSMGYDEGMGYAQGGQGEGQQGGSGYRRGYARGGRGGSGYRRGYRGQSRDSMGRYTSRRGYRRRYGHDDVMQDVKAMMAEADPQEKERLKQQLRQMAEQM